MVKVYFQMLKGSQSVRNSEVSDGSWPIQSLMYVLITYKDEKKMKNEGASVVTTLYSYILDAQVQLTL